MGMGQVGQVTGGFPWKIHPAMRCLEYLGTTLGFRLPLDFCWEKSHRKAPEISWENHSGFRLRCSRDFTNPLIRLPFQFDGGPIFRCRFQGRIRQVGCFPYRKTITPVREKGGAICTNSPRPIRLEILSALKMGVSENGVYVQNDH